MRRCACAKRQYEDDRKRTDETGSSWETVVDHMGGGGKHSVLDEKKMVGGKPSPRRGKLHRAGD